jgi:hypothetical protein
LPVDRGEHLKAYLSDAHRNDAEKLAEFVRVTGDPAAVLDPIRAQEHRQADEQSPIGETTNEHTTKCRLESLKFDFGPSDPRYSFAGHFENGYSQCRGSLPTKTRPEKSKVGPAWQRAQEQVNRRLGAVISFYPKGDE